MLPFKLIIILIYNNTYTIEKYKAYMDQGKLHDKLARFIQLTWYCQRSKKIIMSWSCSSNRAIRNFVA